MQEGVHMIQINKKEVDIGHFPDGTLLLKEKLTTAQAGGRKKWKSGGTMKTMRSCLQFIF